MIKEKLMPVRKAAATADAPPAITPDERHTPGDLAALYRVIARLGMTDLIFTHITARVPGPDRHFLINPYGMLFEEVTASSLIKVDLDGNLIAPTPHIFNPGGF